MPDTVMIDGKEWDLTGLPRHMVEDLPQTVELTTERRRTIDQLRNGCTVRTDRRGRMFEVTKQTVQLERDGVPLTRGDARGWRRGEAEGFKPTRLTQPEPSDEVIDVEAEECA